MTDIMKAVLGGAGLIIALGVIVSATLRHYIGGFMRTVEREAEEEAEREARKVAAKADDDGNNENTGVQQ